MTTVRNSSQHGISLRGPRLESAALKELADLPSWSSAASLTWGQLAARLGVSRQALEAKDAVVDAYHETKRELVRIKNSSTDRGPQSALRQEKLTLKAKLAEAQVQLDRWIERWVTVERLCHLKGINADEIMGTGAQGK